MKDDCRRLRPTKAVSPSQYILTKYANVMLISTMVPATALTILSLIFILVYKFLCFVVVSASVILTQPGGLEFLTDLTIIIQRFVE